MFAYLLCTTLISRILRTHFFKSENTLNLYFQSARWQLNTCRIDLVWLFLRILDVFRNYNFGLPSPVPVMSDSLYDKSRSRYSIPCGHISRTEVSCIIHKQSQIYRDDFYPLILNLLNIKSILFRCTHLC